MATRTPQTNGGYLIYGRSLYEGRPVNFQTRAMSHPCKNRIKSKKFIYANFDKKIAKDKNVKSENLHKSLEKFQEKFWKTKFNNKSGKKNLGTKIQN